MISALDAITLAAPSQNDEVAPTLTEREQSQLDYLDSMVEMGIHKSFTGGVFEFKIPIDKVEMPVVTALKQRYEKGGWQVGIFLLGTAENPIAYQVVFACPGVKAPEKIAKPPKRLPPITANQNDTPRYVEEYRLLVRMPTRGRPIQAIEMLEKYRSMAGCKVAIEVVIDEDDETMHAAEILQRLAMLDCIVTTGKHDSKIAACNGGVYADWDILLLASDDMLPVVDDYALYIIAAMKQYFPYLDGAIHFNDGHQRSNLCTLPIFGRRLWEQFGYIYDPAYKSLFCDREQTDLLKAMGRLAYDDTKIIDHKHHIWGDGVEKDALYERNDALEGVDKDTFNKRKLITRPHAQWAFDSPPMWLSILICSIPKRKKQLNWLLDNLYRQIIRETPRQVEILVDDRLDISVGEKRQSLVEHAKGHFVAFVDDDDGVAWNYCRRVVDALSALPDADCASLEGMMTVRGEKPERFTHSISHDGWFTKAGIHYRWPNHLSAVRRELALEVGFLAKNCGEDHDYSKRLRPLLHKEAFTGKQPLYYYFFNPEQSVQQTATIKVAE